MGCFAIHSHAQRKSIWLGAGAGIASPYGSTITLDFNVQTGRHLYFDLMADLLQGGYYSVTGIGVGAGYIYKNRSLILTLSSGVTMDSNSYYNSLEPKTSVGIPVKVQFYTSTKFAGIGLQGILKFSDLQNYGGVGIIVGFGKMR